MRNLFFQFTQLYSVIINTFNHLEIHRSFLNVFMSEGLAVHNLFSWNILTFHFCMRLNHFKKTFFHFSYGHLLLEIIMPQETSTFAVVEMIHNE